MVPKRLNKPKQYTENEFALKRAEAKALFLAGTNPEVIDKKLDLRAGRTIQWAHSYNWMDEREKVLDTTTQTKLQILLSQQENTFKELATIKEKAFDAIFNDEVRPVKFSEAASAYLNAIEVEKKLKTEALQISFITDVAKVLKEKIQDKMLLYQIAESLKEIFNKYQAKNLSGNDKIVDSEG